MSVQVKLELNMKGFAELCGVTTAALRLWVKEGMPGQSKPARNATYYDVALALPWVRDNKWKVAQDARARKLEAEASVAEMERDVMAGSLVSAADYRAATEDFNSRLRTNLMGFPDRLIPLLEETTDVREKLAIGKREMAATLRDIVTQETQAVTP